MCGVEEVRKQVWTSLLQHSLVREHLASSSVSMCVWLTVGRGFYTIDSTSYVWEILGEICFCVEHL